jgi:peptidoglycan/xylan/chitin deacetylase (PgdA/CDA1 family)
MAMVRTAPVLNTITWLTRDRPRVLMYHRFGACTSWRALGADVFADQMRIVRRRFVAMTVSELRNALRTGKAPANAVAITIDDGYEDAYRYALPVLRSLGLPATFYVTTGFIERATWLWPDRVAYILDHSPLDSARWASNGHQLSVSLDTPARRQQGWFTLTAYIETLPTREARRFLDELAHRLDVTLPETPTQEYRAATWEQLHDLADAGIEIGDHTWSHPLLPRCSRDELEQEIFTSKAILEERLGTEVRSFAYPHGGCNDQVREIVRQAGYQNAVISTNWESLDWTDDFTIPRLSHGGPLPRFQTTISGFYNLAARFGYRAVREEARS